MYYLYILYSASSDRYYVGYSNDTDRRLHEHNFGERTTYTSKHRPWFLVKRIPISTERSLALKIEKAIKRTKSRKVIEKIIAEIDQIECLAQLVSVPIHRD